MVPIQRLKISMIPKWIGFMPSAVHTGRKIGVKIRQAGVISMKVPTISRITLINRKITILLLLMASKPLETAVGILVNAITHDIILETPIRKIIIPVISALSLKILGRSFKLMER